MKTVLSILSATLLLTTATHAAAAPPVATTAKVTVEDAVLAVSEGTSGGLDHARVIAKYADLAERIGQATRQKVRVEFVREFAMLEEGMRNNRFTYVMARPSDYPGRGLRDYGYRYVASAKPEGRCMIYADKGSGITKLEQAVGKKWVMPEEVAYMSRFCRAELRDRGIVLATQNVQHVREQGAVKFYLDNGFGQVGGVASYSGVRKQFDKDGAMLIHQSVPQPYFPLIASSKITPAQVQAVQQMLVALKGEDRGQTVLKQIGVEDFDTGTEDRLRSLNAWLDAAPDKAAAKPAK